MDDTLVSTLTDPQVVMAGLVAIAVFATLYIFSLLGLVVALISDLAYMWVDPRLDFESREV